MDGEEAATHVIKHERIETDISSDHQMDEDTSVVEYEKCTTEDTLLGSSDEDYPLDLRTTRLPPFKEIRKPVLYPKKDKKEVISIAELLENFYYDENFVNYSSPPKLFLANSFFTGCEGSSYEKGEYSSVAPTDYSMHQQNYPPMKYECSKTPCDTDQLWNVGTNTDTVLVVDNETQTLIKETMDKSVQTDVEPERMTYSMENNMQKPDVKFMCSACRRVYASKSSYERHLKTHLLYTKDKKIVSSVVFTTESKMELSKKQVARKHTSNPIIIQMPHRNNLQCEYCKQIFSTQKEKDKHFEDCIIEPFFMTKCPECSVKFYTLECLNRHIGLIHKKSTSTNAYFCIFCNENFDTAYTFQLHLDKHLSP